MIICERDCDYWNFFITQNFYQYLSLICECFDFIFI